MGKEQIPVITYEDVLLVPLQGSLDDEKIQSVKDQLLEKLSGDKSFCGVILDVSAVNVVDSYTARVFGELSQSAKMVGGRCILSGIRPEVAYTLVEMGISLTGLPTALTVKKALKKLRDAEAGEPVNGKNN